mmetsp:Transcript_28473/g.60327  ORF Transcript_28473/g.60327 Transcript_28473/m.60327 type:complete len:464 (-) Transcript_28473:59-1450(-)
MATYCSLAQLSMCSSEQNRMKTHKRRPPIGLIICFSLFCILTERQAIHYHSIAGFNQQREGQMATDSLFNSTYYTNIYNSFGTHESYADVRLFKFDAFSNYKSNHIKSNGCRLTVVINDPRVPVSGFNHPVWYTLESLAAYVPYACLVINTASCSVIHQTKKNTSTTPSKLQKESAVASFIYARSLPLFRRMMERGQVRISILNHEKYGVSCGNFNPNALLKNLNFWLDEFSEGLDSDVVLVAQDDSVFCHHFDVELWKHFAYVGAPWSPTFHPFGGCNGTCNAWHTWTSQCDGLTNDHADEHMPRFCTSNCDGIQGNGGLSLRRRSWMVKALQTCSPQIDANEDLFFSIILYGLGATMPSNFEASLFSVETVFPEQTREYSTLDNITVPETIQKLWGTGTGMKLYKRMHRHESYITNDSTTENLQQLYTIPLAFHKPWLYHPADIINGAQTEKECFFLKFVR